MGLTIHWTWNSDITRGRARELVQALHRYAETLGFENCFEPVEIDWSQPPAATDEMLLRRHSGWPVIADIETPDGIPTSTGDSLDPAWSICFFATDPGTELAFFGFGEYPQIWKFRGKELPTGARGLSWQCSCKTQYASLPDEGGEPNFMAAHLRLVKMCDEARRLGIPIEVEDEGEYWTSHSEDQLLRKLRQYNGLLAAFAGHMKDALGSDAVEAPIRTHQQFEALEAKGYAEFGQKFNEAGQTVRDALKRTGEEK